MQELQEIVLIEGWGDSTAVKSLVLHAANLGSTPTSHMVYGPPSPSGVSLSVEPKETPEHHWV